MLSSNLKLALAIIAALVAAVILISRPDIVQGTGLVIATLAAGAGWLFRDVIESQRAVVAICQSYAAHIEAHFEEISDSLSDLEIDRFVTLAPDIASGAAAQAVGSRVSNPFELLPDIRNSLHLLSPQTVRFISKWRARGTDLFSIYDKLGTREMSSTEHARLVAHYEWVKQYRNEYRDIGYTALQCLGKDAPSVEIDFNIHVNAGAKSLL
jgi:hypothetical protein